MGLLAYCRDNNKILNSVTIFGNVNQPGDYPLDNYSDLKSLIVDAANNIMPYTYLGKVDVSKENLDGSKSFNSYNLEKIHKYLLFYFYRMNYLQVLNTFHNQTIFSFPCFTPFVIC